jgi:hypothetical protein
MLRWDDYHIIFLKTNQYHKLFLIYEIISNLALVYLEGFKYSYEYNNNIIHFWNQPMESHNYYFDH